MQPTHNLDALLIGTGEFSFSEGALTVAAARLAGYRDFGNIKAFTPSAEMSEVIHKGSYRGALRTDKRVRTEKSVIYTIQCDEWDLNKLRIMMGGTAGAGHTQSIQTAAIVDTWAFTSPAPAVVGRWYDITTSAARLTNLTSVNLLTSGTGTSVVGEADDETFTAVAHGLVNGNAIIFRGGTMPTGITENQVYYVVNKTDDTFQVASTAGGSAVAFSTDGTGFSFYPALIEGTDYEVDLVLGRVRFYAARTTTITPTVTAAAITSSSATFLNSFTALTELDPIEGIGRLVCYDQDDTNQVVLDHRDFKCEVAVESTGAIDGTNFSEIQLKVTITDELPGTVFVREA